MNRLKQTDIQLLINTRTEFKITAHPVIYKNTPWWELNIVTIINGKRIQNQLVNKIGKIRYFKKLESIVNFVQETCSNIQNFTVNLN